MVRASPIVWRNGVTRSAARWRVEHRLVRLAGPYGLGHRVVDLQDQLLGAIKARTVVVLEGRKRP